MSDDQHDGARGSAATTVDLLMRIGHLTRQLRDGLKELGLDKQVALAADAIPDARDRLGYIANMTESAAERVLNACDNARPLHERLTKEAGALTQKLQQRAADGGAISFADPLMIDLRSFLAQVPASTGQINAQLLEIMMAQDFQDLTGQVIKKMVEVINQVESELLSVLIQHSFATDNQEVSLENGPQVKPGQPISSQEDVDNLLESMGF